MLVQQRINLCRNHSAHKTENGACSDDWSWEQEHRNAVRNRTESKQTRRTKNEGKEVGPSICARDLAGRHRTEPRTGRTEKATAREEFGKRKKSRRSPNKN
jgi:hypothetical protein